MENLRPEAVEAVDESKGSNELERLLDVAHVQDRRCAANVVIGRLVAFVDPTAPLVTFPGQLGSAAIRARLAADVDERHIGDEMVLQFENGDPCKPVVLARIRRSRAWPADATSPTIQVEADGQRLSVEASEQITLRCGQASITLTKHGKVLIKGTYVLTQSTGVNRIKGGSVQVN